MYCRLIHDLCYFYGFRYYPSEYNHWVNILKDLYFVDLYMNDLPCTLLKLVTKNHTVTGQWSL